MGNIINGQVPIPEIVTGEVVFYASPTARGLGNGLSRENACTLRTAIANASGTLQTTIFLGAGVHNTDNGSDATGTVIDKDYVRIVGLGDGDEIGQSSQIANKAASATHVLRVTGNRFACSHIAFDNSAETDKSVTHLKLSGSYNTIKNCVFRQGAADTGVTGIYIDNASVSHTIEGCRFRRISDYGINFNDASRFYVNNNVFWKCGKAIYASHANADGFIGRNNSYLNCTTAIDIAAAIAKSWYFMTGKFMNNGTNFADVAAYGVNCFFEDIKESGRHGNTSPADAGVSINTGDGAWAWTASATQIIPKNTLAKPFKITAIHPQDWTAAQTYKIEIFYGETTGDVSIGVFEFSVGDPVAKGRSSSPIMVDIYIPPYAYVGAKIKSSTAGVDNLVMTLGYELL